MSQLLGELSKGFLKTQKSEVIDKITDSIAGIFDDFTTSPNEILNLDQRDKALPTLQYPLDLDNESSSSQYSHHIVFTAKEYGSSLNANSIAASSGNDLKTNTKFDDRVTTKSIIYLYQPHDFNISYNNNWESEELGVASSFGGDLSTMKSIFGEAGIRKLTEKGLDFAGFKSGIAGLERSQGKAYNPRLSVLFKGVSQRQFSFDFQFAPRSEEEVLHCIAIIKSFKYFAAPSFLNNGSYFKYPEIFDIKMVNKNKENDSIHKFGRSALTKIDINYSPQSIWQTFANGFPVEVKMTLNFIEIDLITKKDIASGK